MFSAPAEEKGGVGGQCVSLALWVVMKKVETSVEPSALMVQTRMKRVVEAHEK
jgi:hypothetical protein